MDEIPLFIYMSVLVIKHFSTTPLHQEAWIHSLCRRTPVPRHTNAPQRSFRMEVLL